MAILPWARSTRPLLLFIVLCIAHSSWVHAQECPHGAGLWGSVKDGIRPIAEPVGETIRSKYNGLSDKGRFVAGAVAGFGASRLVVGTTVKTVKTVGAAYIAFEALEYAGMLKEARTEQNKQLLAQSRDYVLRTVDGIRHDIRNQVNPKTISSRVKRCMEKDKSGTVGFGTGAFLGFAL